MSKATDHSGSMPPQVGLVTGTRDDWEVMRSASDVLTDFGIPHEWRVLPVSHDLGAVITYASRAEDRGLRVIVAAGAAPLPGLLAANTTVPVLGVPLASQALHGLDALLAMVQMPRGLPVGTLAIGEAGAANAALLATAVLALTDPAVRARLQAFRDRQTRTVLDDRLPLDPVE